MFKPLLANLLWVGSPSADRYRDILMKAHPGLHGELSELLTTRIPLGARVLDLGAGHGAFSRRLTDLGFSVLAVDQDEASFQATEVEFRRVDFNDPAAVAEFTQAQQGQFDAVIGMEVIEHVENPWEYVRLLTRLAKPGGLVVVTTPNVQSWVAQWNQLVSSRPYHFELGDETSSGHINPVPSWELLLIARRTGLTDGTIVGLCRLPWFWVTRNVKLMLGGVLMLPFMIVGRHMIAHDIVALIARKPASDRG
jgi:SAM-dependent methyltransferase